MKLTDIQKKVLLHINNDMNHMTCDFFEGYEDEDLLREIWFNLIEQVKNNEE